MQALQNKNIKCNFFLFYLEKKNHKFFYIYLDLDLFPFDVIQGSE